MTGKQPNIIYILTDDQRAELLGIAGHPHIRTPNLDRLAREGAWFRQAFCTSPVCTPSRTSHYLGQWERKHGINFNSSTCVSEENWDESFPMKLKEAGYFLGWVGKNHVPVGDGGYKSGYLESVFDYWYGNHGHSGFYVKEGKQREIYHNAQADTQIEVFEEGFRNFLDPQSDFIESCTHKLPYRPKDKPFCLCITYNLPHSNGTGTMKLRPEDDELYCLGYRDVMERLPLPDTYIAHEDIEAPRLPKEVYSGVYLPSYDYVKSPEALRERLVRMYQTVTGIDRSVGRLLDLLDRLGLADNTIIVYSSDHGIHFGEHGLGGKCFLYEEDLRIPLIVYDPRLPQSLRGQVRSELALVPDLAPTVLGLAGVPIPEAMQGTSLAPLIREEPIGWRTDFFAEQLMDIQNYPKSECIRSEDWKYIRYFPRTEDPQQAGESMRSTLDDYGSFLRASILGEIGPVFEELYHLAEDPMELRNLARDPGCADMLIKLRRRLSELAEALL